MLPVHATSTPVVSVVMATYNRAAFLPRSISSYLRQHYTGSELLVVDDGSTDETFYVVNEFMKKDARIRYMRHSNRKVSLTRNAGILAATGRYIAFLDSDDAFTPDYLSSRVHYMESHPDTELIQGGCRVVGQPFVRDKTNPSQLIHVSSCHIGGTFFGKREVFIETGGFNPEIRYSEDSEFWERASAIFKTAIIKKPGYVYYRDAEDSICAQGVVKQTWR